VKAQEKRAPFSRLGKTHVSGHIVMCLIMLYVYFLVPGAAVVRCRRAGPPALTAAGASTAAACLPCALECALISRLP
jgi:hypothetical protein